MIAPHVVVFAAFGIAVVPPPASSQSIKVPASQPAGAQTPAPPKHPYRRLFEPQAGAAVEKLRRQAEQRLQQETARRGLPQPEVVCGTTIIPADPSIDPKFVLEIPRTTEHTIRRVPPPVCRP